MLSLLFIFLNVGLYLVFVFNDWLKIKKNVRIGFSLFFLVVYIFWEVSKSPHLDLMRISISLLGLYLIGSLVLMLILKFFEHRNVRIEKIAKQFVLFILLPTYTLIVTAIQIMFLFKT